MKQLYIMRHAETNTNASGKWSGHYEALLTDQGKLQAKLAGQKIKDEDWEVDIIISSPAIRTKETARLVADVIEYPADDIVIESLAIERALGLLENQPAAIFLADHTYKDIDDVDGAEQVKDLQVRADELLERLKYFPEDNVLIVTHGAMGRALRRSVLGLAYESEYDENHRRKYGLTNAEIVKLDI
jgi:probable phosphoglycerate mutase